MTKRSLFKYFKASAEITRLADFGAFAKLESDIEGLIHVSELSDEELAPGDVVSPGQRLTVRIIRIDPERKRIGLSLKRAGADFDALGLPYEDDIEDRSADDGPDGATEAPASIEMEAGSDPADASEPSLVAEPTGD